MSIVQPDNKFSSPEEIADYVIEYIRKFEDQCLDSDHKPAHKAGFMMREVRYLLRDNRPLDAGFALKVMINIAEDMGLHTDKTTVFATQILANLAMIHFGNEMGKHLEDGTEMFRAMEKRAEEAAESYKRKETVH